MRVCHVITGLGTGGAETQLRLLLQQTRHDADVVTLHNPGAIADQIRSDGTRVTDIGMQSNTDVRALGDLARVIRAGRYDVVHTHLYRACLYGRVAARLVGVPRIVATEHSLLPGMIEGRRTTRGVRALYRTSERLGDLTVAVSDTVRDELLGWGVPADRIAVVPNGLGLRALAFDPEVRRRGRAELGIAEDALVIGGVGRLVPGKEFAALVTAAAPLLSGDRVLLIVGVGPERDHLDQLAADLGVSGHVRFAGERAAADLLPAMDVFASPSTSETFGLAILEALASGMPVVHRRCPALTELDGPVTQATFCADTGEFARALATAVPRSERTCPPSVAAMDIASVAQRLDDLYASLPARTGRGGRNTTPEATPARLR
ncbi:MAG: hypothetical protein JWQ53_2017 [Klenkia sp.]|nr:hypothetical protein [Klenkia sp.]